MTSGSKFAKRTLTRKQQKAQAKMLEGIKRHDEANKGLTAEEVWQKRMQEDKPQGAF